MYKICIYSDKDDDCTEINTNDFILASDRAIYSERTTSYSAGKKYAMLIAILENILIDIIQAENEDIAKELNYRNDVSNLKKYIKSDDLIEKFETTYKHLLNSINNSLIEKFDSSVYGSKNAGKDYTINITENEYNTCAFVENSNNILISSDEHTVIFEDQNIKNLSKQEQTNFLFKHVCRIILYILERFISLDNNISVKDIDKLMEKADDKIYNQMRLNLYTLYKNVDENLKMQKVRTKLNNGEKYVLDDDYIRQYTANKNLKNILSNFGFNFEDDEDDEDDEEDN